MWIPPDEHVFPYDGITKNQVAPKPWDYQPSRSALPRPPFRKSLPYRTPASLLTITPQHSILSPHVLNAMKMKLIVGEKRKNDTNNDDTNNKKLITTREIHTAEAAYSIARNLVEWMETSIVIDDDEVSTCVDEKLEEDTTTTTTTRSTRTSTSTEIKLEHTSHDQSYIGADEKLEDEIEIKREPTYGTEIKLEYADEKKRDTSFYGYPSLFSTHSYQYQDDDWRATDLDDIITPLTQTSELSCDATTIAAATPSTTATTTMTTIVAPSHDMITSRELLIQQQQDQPFSVRQHEQSSDEFLPHMDPSLLPSLSELNDCIPIFQYESSQQQQHSLYEKMDMNVFPSSMMDGWMHMDGGVA